MQQYVLHRLLSPKNIFMMEGLKNVTLYNVVLKIRNLCQSFENVNENKVYMMLNKII